MTHPRLPRLRVAAALCAACLLRLPASGSVDDPCTLQAMCDAGTARALPSPTQP